MRYAVSYTHLDVYKRQGVYEDANISSNARIRFYAVANRQDTDGDGLTDGAEIFVHHTNPGNPDTDGDGWSDAEELAAGTEPLDRFSATKLARDVVLNEVLYNATGPDLGYEWIELYCAGRYPVNLGNFVIQVADTAYSNAYVFPVSYTHLDVYKRQGLACAATGRFGGGGASLCGGFHGRAGSSGVRD